MDERKKESGIDRLFRFFFLTATLMFAAVAGAYICRFAPGSPGLSQNPADWAEFGEYMGGTLGGVFGLLAFIGVLITLVQQRSQIDLQRQQSIDDDQHTESRFYLDEYRAGYETAFSILDSAAVGDPQMRVKWIAAARVLETARRIAERITSAAHRDVMLLDLPHQALRFSKFFEYPAMYYYGVSEQDLMLREGEEYLNEAARSATRKRDNVAQLRQIPGKAIQTIWFAVQYPKDYEDVMGGDFDEADRLFLTEGLQAYLNHTDRWYSILGQLVARTKA